jgi:hypothetical protein
LRANAAYIGHHWHAALAFVSALHVDGTDSRSERPNRCGAQFLFGDNITQYLKSCERLVQQGRIFHSRMALAFLGVQVNVRMLSCTILVTCVSLVLVSFVYNTSELEIKRVVHVSRSFERVGLLRDLDDTPHLNRFPLNFQVEFLGSIVPKCAYRPFWVSIVYH